MEEFIKDLMEVLVKHKVNPGTYLRDAQMKQRYRELRKDGYSCKEAQRILSEEFYISVKTIERVLYVREKRERTLN